MINNLSQAIAERWLTKEIISQQEYELYHYALFVILSDLWMFAFTLSLGILFKTIVPSIVFFVVFFAIRRFAGGFHAKTELQCQIISLSFLTASVVATKYLIANVQFKWLLLIYLVCAVVLPIVSPADTPQKPLSHEEKIRFKKIMCVVSLIFLVLSIALYYFDQKKIMAPVVSAFVLETILVIFGRCFNKRLS